MIVVTGATGQLGGAFARTLEDEAVLLTRSDLDLAEPVAAASVIADLQPDVVINCAAYTDVDAAETDESTATAVNGVVVGALAAACRDVGARFVTFSTDYVFDGSKRGGYVESDEPRPINAYGRSKFVGEQLAVAANPDSLIVRTSWLLSSTHPNFVRTMLVRMRDGEVRVVDDQRGRPTIVDDLAAATLGAVTREMTGVLHLAGDHPMTWYDLARMAAGMAGIDPDRVHPCSSAEYPRAAPRPANSVLDSERSVPDGPAPLRDFDTSLQRIVVAITSG